jgi:hypothetical protein
MGGGERGRGGRCSFGEQGGRLDNDADFGEETLTRVKYMIIKDLEFPRGNRPYGGGGWSRNARHRPLPEIRTLRVPNKSIEYAGKSVYVQGIRKLKLNIFTNKGQTRRMDYPGIGHRTELVPKFA